jgi:hypothetical protein
VVVRHMLKEFNSSMAMGALKQLDSDAERVGNNVATKYPIGRLGKS